MRIKKIDTEQYVDDFLEKYADLPIVELDSVIWEGRPKTRIIKWLMSQGHIDQATMAKYLGCKKPYLDNKMTRDSFSIDDLLIAAYACGYSLTLTKNTSAPDHQESYVIDIVDYFKSNDDEVLVRITEIEKELKENKKAEYERKKAELEMMKREYGFSD